MECRHSKTGERTQQWLFPFSGWWYFSTLGPLCPPSFVEGRTKDLFHPLIISAFAEFPQSPWGDLCDTSVSVQGFLFLSLVPWGPIAALRVFIPQAEGTSQAFPKWSPNSPPWFYTSMDSGLEGKSPHSEGQVCPVLLLLKVVLLQPLIHQDFFEVL